MVHVRNANGELRDRRITARHPTGTRRHPPAPAGTHQAPARHTWVRRSGESVHPERRSLHVPSGPVRAYGNVSFQLLMRPTSCAATSCTFNFQVPLATSDEASTV